MKARLSLVSVILVLVILACNAPKPTVAPLTAEPRAVTTPLPITPPPPPPPNVHGPGFAAFPKISAALPAAYSGYTLPVEMSAVKNARQFKFSLAQTRLILQNGFVVAPAQWLEFFQVYEAARYQEIPVFVTTDAVYHVYHLLFNKMLRDLEREKFAPDIAALTRACAGSARDLYSQLKGTPLEKTALRVWAYFVVADNLISADASIPAEVAPLVKGELALIEAHGGLRASPIFGVDCPQTCNPCDPNPPAECLNQPCMCEDYSQYVPRGHYTRSEQLQRYFRTMMWYGRINLRLQKPDETRMALFITYILRNTRVGNEPAAEVWARVYDPTVFIVGKADDLGFHEYGALWNGIYGPQAAPGDLADDNKLATFTAAARQLPPPQINSMWVYIWEDKAQATQGFRFMGQRFTLDAYIFQQLVWRNVGSVGHERWLPKGLDVMAALGSEEAYKILDGMGETAYEKYPQQMTKVRSEIAALQLDSWTQNLYWSWLYALRPLLEPKDNRYPSFMQTQAWTRKDLHTALGSWTELKHDTILYAKQVMAEMGGGGEEPEPPRGWVEPNPEAYARLLALTRMTNDGLSSRGLLTDNTRANLERMDSLLSFLLDVAQKELAGQGLSQDEYERLKYIGGELEVMTLAAADPQGEGAPYFTEDEQAALVADVATDPNGQALEEATGYIFEIYVIVPDGRGRLNIAKGGVYSYYEFPWPISDRLTDEAWRAMLKDGRAPGRPDWTTSFIAE